MNVKQTIGLGVLALGITLIMAIAPQYIEASDHDDGEVDTKGRNVNLTDLFVFREQDQNPAARQDDLIFMMNTNPRSLPRQQYYFSDSAQYTFKIGRVNNKDAAPTGKSDLSLRFQFSKPGASGQQDITVTAFRNGKQFAANAKTTPLNNAPILNEVSLAGSKLTVFAGLREDPFFFDVEQFFRVRAGLLDIGPDVDFRSPETAIDFTKGYNVNSIVVRVPRAFLQASTSAEVFDVYERILVRDPRTRDFNQFERLARPVINEGLVVTNDFLNAFNTIGPSNDLSAAAAPVRTEAAKTLEALGNSPDRINTLVGAFLPDVMRIDTTVPSGYLNATNAKGSPIAGRMLTDDVFDMTLQVLTNNPEATDNVSYEGEPGNPAQGHTPLEPDFPYLQDLRRATRGRVWSREEIIGTVSSSAYSTVSANDVHQTELLPIFIE